MSKNKYKVSISFSYDLESEKEHEVAVREAEEELNRLTHHIVLTTKHIRIEKIRQPKHRPRLGEFKLEEVLPFVSKEEKKKTYVIDEKSYEVRMDSQRYFVFRENNVCVSCGLVGDRFLLENSVEGKSPHFNLYGMENGKLILMTKDHIQAKAYGGVDIHSNYQCMCAVCNNLKGALNIPLEKVKELRNIYNQNKNLPRKRFKKLIEDAREKFKLPQSEFHVPRKDRKTFLAQLKSKEDAVVTNVDIRIWKTNEGNLLGKSIYEKVENATEIASIRIGTMLKPLSNNNSKVLVRLNEDEVCEIYQGYLEFIIGE